MIRRRIRLSAVFTLVIALPLTACTQQGAGEGSPASTAPAGAAATPERPESGTPDTSAPPDGSLRGTAPETSATDSPQTPASDASSHGGVPSAEGGAAPSSNGTDAPPAPTGAQVTPVPTFAGAQDGSFTVNAYVPVVDSGGTCLLHASANGRTAQAQASAVADAEVTWCDVLAIPLADLGSGQWTYEVTYRSQTHAGTTGTLTGEVR